MKRETILADAPKTNSAVGKTSDKSDKTRLKTCSDGVLSLLSSILRPHKSKDTAEIDPRLPMPARRHISTEWRDGGMSLVHAQDWTASTVDSPVQPEQPMSQVEASAE